MRGSSAKQKAAHDAAMQQRREQTDRYLQQITTKVDARRAKGESLKAICAVFQISPYRYRQFCRAHGLPTGRVKRTKAEWEPTVQRKPLLIKPSKAERERAAAEAALVAVKHPLRRIWPDEYSHEEKAVLRAKVVAFQAWARREAVGFVSLGLAN